MTLRRLDAGGPILCLITDLQLVGRGRMEQIVADAIRGGINLVQLREKSLPTRELLDLALRLREVTAERAQLLVNGRADVALAARADGVHLPGDGMPVKAARQLLGAGARRSEERSDEEPPGVGNSGFGLQSPGGPSLRSGRQILVGQSVHTVEEAQLAAGEAADYVELGTIFPSPSHPGGAVLGLEPIRQAAGFSVPVLAVGGIKPSNVSGVIEAGASGVAVISAILAAPDPLGAAERLADAAQRAWERSRANLAGVNQ